jgi:long-chain acyl-CoA synthetase
VFAGYWNRPEATADAIRDGWFHTGDQCELTQTGNLKIIGRVKNILVPESGHNIAPEPIEQKFLDACPTAAQCMLVGHARPWLALLVPGEVRRPTSRPRSTRSTPTSRTTERSRPSCASPEAFTIENGLLTANQKLRRKAVERRYAAEVDRVYAS